jgi:hypothetical protein
MSAQRAGAGPLLRPLQHVDEAKGMVATVLEALVASVEAALPEFAPAAARVAAGAEQPDAHGLPPAPWIPAVAGRPTATPTYGLAGQPPALLGLEPLETALFVARIGSAVGLVAEAVRAAAPKLGGAAWVHHVDDAVAPRVLRLKLVLARLLVDAATYGSVGAQAQPQAHTLTSRYISPSQSCASLGGTRRGRPTWYGGGLPPR